jgi:hypothetical protein
MLPPLREIPPTDNGSFSILVLVLVRRRLDVSLLCFLGLYAPLWLFFLFGFILAVGKCIEFDTQLTEMCVDFGYSFEESFVLIDRQGNALEEQKLRGVSVKWKAIGHAFFPGKYSPSFS